MGLEHTNIPDRQGAAIYFLYDGSEREKLVMERLMTHIERRTTKQLVLLSTREPDGRKVIQFYHLQGTKFVLIVRDDDQLHHMWTNGDQFDAAHIAYLAEQLR